MKQPSQFQSRSALIAHVASLSPWARGEASSLSVDDPLQNFAYNIDPITYATTRNFGNGKISYLSPYINHGLVTLNEVRNHALSLCDESKEPMQPFKS